MGYLKEEINSHDCGILNLGFSWLKQINSQCRNKQTYFIFFSKYSINDCIIVSQEHYVIDKVYNRPINVNYVDTGMKLRVYTWFP